MYSVLITSKGAMRSLDLIQRRQLLEQLPSTITYNVSMGYGQKFLSLYTVHNSFFGGG